MKTKTLERRTLDPSQQKTRHSGVRGFFERCLRAYRVAIHALVLFPLYGIAAFCMGLALTPGLGLVRWVLHATANWQELSRLVTLGIAVAAAYFLYGFTLLFLVPLMNFFLSRRLRPWRGPYYSVECVRWYVHNGLTYLLRYTFLDLITPTPFNILFYKLMGMKVGRDSQINTSNISDPSLIELGSHVTIGGSATLLAHYGMGGYLVIAPVRIGDGATIGLKATIMGGVEVGSRATVLPNSVVLPRTIIPAGETWGGVPARKIELRKAA